MANTIRLKQGTGSDPSASDLVLGEPAIRTDTGEIFLKKDDGTIAKVAGGIDDGDKGDVTVSNDGATFTIDDGVVSNAKIASNTISGDRLVNNTITATQINANAITASELADNAVDTAAIANGAVTSAKILDSTIVGGDIAETTISGAKLINGTLTNTQINASAAIAGTKISPDFGNQAISGRDITLTDSDPAINFVDSGDNPDYQVVVNSGHFQIKDATAAADRLYINASSTTITNNLNVSSGLDVTGNITVTGTVDGVDIAARNTLFGGLTSSSGVLTNGVTATTQSASDNSTKVATTAYTDTAISNLINGAPAALDTLNELAAAMADDAAFSTTVTNSLATKLPLAGGEITGNITCSGSQTFDGRDLSVDGSKLDGIESGATADQSASEILTLIKTVDGSGSGLDADLLDGASTDVDASGNSIVKRHSNGYIYATYFNTAPNDISDGSITKLCAESGNDGWIRHAGAAAVRTFLNVENGATADQSASEILTLLKTVDGSGSGLDADTLDGVSSGSFLRSDADDTATGTLTVRDVKLAAGYHLQRSDHHSGHLEGSYNNVAGNSYKSNPIYSIGSSYNPADASLSNFYGVGYSHTNASFISFTGASGWGFYVASDGDARVWLGGGNGVISSTGQHYVGSNVVWNAGNDGSGSGLDADLWDGNQFSSYLNQAVLTSSNPRFNNVYTPGWFRNDDAGDGLYNQSTGMHWYSANAGYFDIGGGQSGQGIRCRDNHNGTLRGYFYYDNSNRIGILDADGNWAVKVVKDVAVEFRVNDTIEATIEPDTFQIKGCFFENAQAVEANKTISNGFNAMSAGPITINSGVTVTIGSGETWTIV